MLSRPHSIRLAGLHLESGKLTKILRGAIFGKLGNHKMNFRGDEGRPGIYRGVVPSFRGAMAFLNLLTLFQGEGVTWAAILSLSVRRQSLKNYGSEKKPGSSPWHSGSSIA